MRARKADAPLEVSTGEVRIAESGMLKASALGSCVGVVVVDVEAGIGGMAHVMLPGGAPVAPDPSSEAQDLPKTRYAADAVAALIEAAVGAGARAGRLQAVLAGGADVLGDGRRVVGKSVLSSVLAELAKRGILLRASDVGGNQRRSLTFDAGLRRVLLTVGDSGSRLLWMASPPKEPEDDPSEGS